MRSRGLGGPSGDALAAILVVLVLQINALQPGRLSSVQLRRHEIHTEAMMIR